MTVVVNAFAMEKVMGVVNSFIRYHSLKNYKLSMYELNDGILHIDLQDNQFNTVFTMNVNQDNEVFQPVPKRSVKDIGDTE